MPYFHSLIESSLYQVYPCLFTIFHYGTIMIHIWLSLVSGWVCLLLYDRKQYHPFKWNPLPYCWLRRVIGYGILPPPHIPKAKSRGGILRHLMTRFCSNLSSDILIYLVHFSTYLLHFSTYLLHFSTYLLHFSTYLLDFLMYFPCPSLELKWHS